MIPVELFTNPMVGQFWLEPRSMKLYEITLIRNSESILTKEYIGSISNERGMRLPMQNILLWSVVEAELNVFPSPPKAGQAWVNKEDGEVFIVSPNQLNPEKVTLLSTSSKFGSSPILIHEPELSVNSEKPSVLIQ